MLERAKKQLNKELTESEKCICKAERTPRELQATGRQLRSRKIIEATNVTRAVANNDKNTDCEK